MKSHKKHCLTYVCLFAIRPFHELVVNEAWGGLDWSRYDHHAHDSEQRLARKGHGETTFVAVSHEIRVTGQIHKMTQARTINHV